MWERWIPFARPFAVTERREGYVSTATIPSPREGVNRSDMKEIKNDQGYQPRKRFHEYYEKQEVLKGKKIKLNRHTNSIILK